MLGDYSYFTKSELNRLYFSNREKWKAAKIMADVRCHKFTNKKFKRELKNIYADELDQIKLQEKGILKFKFSFQTDICEYAESYFSSSICYKAHVPLRGRLVNKEALKLIIDSESDYLSYDLMTQVNFIPLLNFCLHKEVLHLAQSYLKCPPKLLNINTFWTIPGKENENKGHFTHSFHRDLDDLLFLTFFIFWTETENNNGSFEYICGTHRPSDDLDRKLEERVAGDTDLGWVNSLEFFKNTIPGYGHDSEYLKVFFKRN